MEKLRLTNWWMRWEDLKWPSPDAIDRIKYKADKYVEANISTAVIYGCHFRWDYMPFFTLLHDYLATVAEELHQRGIRLYDHHSVNLVHRYDTREEMRHVMLHSGPHIPFCPSRTAAATWEYGGKRMNNWRMIDVRDRSVLYFPQYAAEGFCHRNPEFQEAYQNYALSLIQDTGIDGLMADDAMYYYHFNACACPHCRAELKRRTGMDLPPIDDRSFWYNWENPAWKAWIDLRFDATSEFHAGLRKRLPQDFPTMSCGASSASNSAVGSASDARAFLGGCNYVNLELCGNTPPYKYDPVTVNRTIAHQVVNASHHQASARQKNVRCYGTGYGFTEPSANIIWAVNKFLDADCHFSTLKPRLGLPDKILDTLPDEFDVVGKAYTFEKNHLELFDGDTVAQVGVYYCDETKNHTCFGYMGNGYFQDYQATLLSLFRAGISFHTVFRFPEDPQTCPLTLISSAAAMTETDIAQLRKYLSAGGKVIVTGPSPLPECKNTWHLPTRPREDVAPRDLFTTIRDGVWTQGAKWVSDPIADSDDADLWTQPEDGMFYNPCRICNPAVSQQVVALCREHGKAMPLEILFSQGYLTSIFQGETGITVQFLAEDFDTDIDHHLDEIRFHRSRVNYINHVEPIGVTQTLKIRAKTAPKVYTPFQDEGAKVDFDGELCTITLPEKCAYALVRIEKA